jgi:hypothetical protein
VLRTVPIPVETILVTWNIPSLETEGSVDAMKNFVKHETGKIGRPSRIAFAAP